MGAGTPDEGPPETGRFEGALLDGRFEGGRIDGGRLGAGVLIAGLLAGTLDGGLLEGETLGGRLLAGALLGLATGALLGGATLDGESGLTLGLLVRGKRMLMTSAMLSVAVSTPGYSLFTSWSNASVWLRVPRAFLTHVLPSSSVEAYSASKSAPTDRAMF